MTDERTEVRERRGASNVATSEDIELRIERRVQAAERLVRMEEKIDQCLMGIVRLETKDELVSARVTVLETWRSWTIGVGAAVAAIVSYFSIGR